MEEIPKLRLAHPEQVRAFDPESFQLSATIAPYRVGSVPYLNAVPLTRGLEKEILFVEPSRLAVMLRNNELDAALVSITEVMFNDMYDVLDGVAVASLGEVKSVFLACHKPLSEVREVYCDPASLTSVNLLRVLLLEKGLAPEFKVLEQTDNHHLPDHTLLIGNRAIDFLLANPGVEVWDLGTAWYELTRLPFVYAVWALRRGAPNVELRKKLREAKDLGMETLDLIISSAPQWNYAFRKDYLSWHIHYHLGTDEKRGVEKFIELLRKHQLGPVYNLNYVL